MDDIGTTNISFLGARQSPNEFPSCSGALLFCGVRGAAVWGFVWSWAVRHTGTRMVSAWFGFMYQIYDTPATDGIDSGFQENGPKKTNQEREINRMAIAAYWARGGSVWSVDQNLTAWGPMGGVPLPGGEGPALLSWFLDCQASL